MCPGENLNVSTDQNEFLIRVKPHEKLKFQHLKTPIAVAKRGVIGGGTRCFGLCSVRVAVGADK
jgi:hypothetical protein